MSSDLQLPRDYLTKLLQDHAEHDAFVRLLLEERVTSYLEVGLGWAASLWRVGNALPKGSRIVGVDICPDEFVRADMQGAADELNERGYDACLIWGDSTDQQTIAATQALAPFDCVFIDGNHSYDGVKSDWENYGPLGRIVAFHDISFDAKTWRSKVPGRVPGPLDVPRLWAELKPLYRHREIKLYHRQNYYGIGVLWRY